MSRTPDFTPCLVQVQFAELIPYQQLLGEAPTGDSLDRQATIWSNELQGTLAVGETVTVAITPGQVYNDGGDQALDVWLNGKVGVIVDIETSNHLLLYK